MDRRFLTVLAVSLVFALIISGIFYQMAARGSGSARQEPTDLVDVVIAAKPLPVGVTIKPDDIKLTKVPGAQFPRGGFSKVEDVIDRPVVSNILLDEPLMEGRLAARGSGLGLAPIIPVGMRAVSVRVNDVVGVAGFVLPGMRVDVLVTGQPQDGARGRMTTTVLQNILVLSAGQKMEADARGQAISAPTVTLLVSPEQAELLTLAGSEGQIQLVLRNGSDQGMEKTPGRHASELFGGRRAVAKPEADEERPRPRPRPVAAAPAPPPPVVPQQVVVYRGTTRTVEQVQTSRHAQPVDSPAGDPGRVQ
ncbi:MAG: Flp pilus assembly protein CpaB [Bryobacteraceae bacterium]